MERLLLFSRRQSIHQLLLPNLALNEQHQLGRLRRLRPHVHKASYIQLNLFNPHRAAVEATAESCLSAWLAAFCRTSTLLVLVAVATSAPADSHDSFNLQLFSLLLQFFVLMIQCFQSHLLTVSLPPFLMN